MALLPAATEALGGRPMYLGGGRERGEGVGRGGREGKVSCGIGDISLPRCVRNYCD